MNLLGAALATACIETKGPANTERELLLTIAEFDFVDKVIVL